MLAVPSIHCCRRTAAANIVEISAGETEPGHFWKKAASGRKATGFPVDVFGETAKPRGETAKATPESFLR